jgi:hypothetical protein
MYNPNGTDYTDAAPNSASIVGTSAVGAMSGTSAAATAYVSDAYQLILDMLNRGEIGDRAASAMSKKSAYSYYNATVGLLTLLTMSGNLTQF